MEGHSIKESASFHHCFPLGREVGWPRKEIPEGGGRVLDRQKNCIFIQSVKGGSQTLVPPFMGHSLPLSTRKMGSKIGASKNLGARGRTPLPPPFPNFG